LNLSNLIKKSISGDRVAQKQFYLQYCDLVMSIAIRYTPDLHQAMDIVQNTFIKAFQYLHTYDDTQSHLSTWISTISIRESITYIKKNQKWQLDESIWDNLEDLEDAIEHQTYNQDNIEILKKVIDKLPLPQRTIIMMYYYDEMSHKEIADILDIRESNSRSRLHKAKENLKIQLQLIKK
jgi:RNA polymerase sigma factor (sigma-70 family)